MTLFIDDISIIISCIQEFIALHTLEYVEQRTDIYKTLPY
jgi:hypothetical protein